MPAQLNCRDDQILTALGVAGLVADADAPFVGLQLAPLEERQAAWAAADSVAARTRLANGQVVSGNWRATGVNSTSNLLTNAIARANQAMAYNPATNPNPARTDAADPNNKCVRPLWSCDGVFCWSTHHLSFCYDRLCIQQ